MIDTLAIVTRKARAWMRKYFCSEMCVLWSLRPRVVQLGDIVDLPRVVQLGDIVDLTLCRTATLISIVAVLACASTDVE